MVIEGYGRTGWFIVRTARVQNMDKILEGYVAIELSDHDPDYNLPPVYLRGPKKKIIRLLENLLEQVKNA